MNVMAVGRFLVVAGALMMAAPANSYAAVTEKDVQVIGRVIALLNNGPQGTVELAMAEAGGASHADVQAMSGIIGDGKTVGALKLTAKPVRYDSLAGSGAKVVYIPDGMSESEISTVFATAKARNMVTISTSDTCLKIQKCAIAVSTNPAVDIRLSIAAAAATSVSFGSTFRMIIKEVE